MQDVLAPRERHDAVVFIGVDRRENVEFIRVYALDKVLAAKTLQEFFEARGILPSDFVVVERGFEGVKGKGAITTRSEGELSAKLSRLGLKLLSNGVLFTSGVKEVYSMTLVSQRLLGEFSGKSGSNSRETTKLKLLDLGESALVENLRGIDLRPYLPENALLLREPEVERAAALMESGKLLIVETADASKYSSLEFSVVIRLPPLSPGEFAEEVSHELGFEVPYGMFVKLPPEKRGVRNARVVARVARKLREKTGKEWEEALSLALRLHLGV